MNFEIKVFSPSNGLTKTIEHHNLKVILDKVTQAVVERALIESKGNKCEAARLIGINRNTLSGYFKKLPQHTRDRLGPNRILLQNVIAVNRSN